MVRRILSDKAWKQFEEALGMVRDPRGAPSDRGEREFLETVLYLARTGAPWRDVPEEFGHWLAVYMRFRRWEKAGVWRRLWEVLQQGAAPVAMQLFVDSTSFPVHPHAAGAGKNGASQALGRSRGGLTTKLHGACVDEATAVAVVLTEGQRHDSVPFAQVYAQACATGQVERVIADKAYDGNPVRDLLAAEGVKTTIPSPCHRRTKSRWWRRHYRQRHKVENFFRRLFDFRRIATRYEKLAVTFLAMVHLTSALVLVRHFVNTP